MPLLQRFHNSVASIRSHHWKYYCDIYSRCTYRCRYCLYYGTREKELPEKKNSLKQELEQLNGLGVVYLGATADVYQVGVDLNQTLRALNLFLVHRKPIFLITRSPQVISHMRVLQEMASLGLIEVSITVNTRNILFRRHFEPGTVPHKERLEVARTLVRNGVPVSFHFSPIIPGLDSSEELLSMMAEMVQTGASCVYSCLYGMNADYRENLIPLFDAVRPGLGKILSHTYSVGATKTISPSDDIALATIKPLASYAKEHKITFVSAQFPSLDVGERTGGIFREKLPTVADLLKAPSSSHLELSLEDLLHYVQKFPAVDQEYLTSLKNYWYSGELFKNTTLAPIIEDGIIRFYRHKDALDIGTQVMQVTR